jgi:hypothetical protein
VVFKDLDFAPQKWLVDTDDVQVAKAISEGMSRQLHRQVGVQTGAVEGLANSLPTLGAVASLLPTSQLISGRSIEQWDVRSARFKAAVDAAQQGFYRLDSFTRSYVIRSSEDLKNMSSKLVDVRLGKYLMALEEEVPLLGYDQACHVLYAPLGAELPLLYARLAAFSFGEPPKENLKESLIEYHNVSPVLAGTIINLLSQ